MSSFFLIAMALAMVASCAAASKFFEANGQSQRFKRLIASGRLDALEQPVSALEAAAARLNYDHN